MPSSKGELTTMHAALRPYRSAINGSKSVPMTPPAWKTPLKVPMRALALSRLARSKYVMNDGWPSLPCQHGGRRDLCAIAIVLT